MIQLGETNFYEAGLNALIGASPHGSAGMDRKEPEHEPQRYVAYRASSDQFEINFYGGPLDGARIHTDVFPDRETFAHRVRDRSYTYRYRHVAKLQFEATLVPATAPPSHNRRRASFGRRTATGAVLALAALALALSLWRLFAA